MMRSMPMQFWPAAWKVPRRRISITRGRSLRALSRIMAASLPPNSATMGVRDLAADAATSLATGRLPMNVTWEIDGWEVR